MTGMPCKAPYGRSAIALLGWLAAMVLLLGSAVCMAHADDVYVPKAGEVAPLEELFARLRKNFQGRILKVELEREGADSAWYYEVKLLTPEGHVLKIEYNARTLELRQVKGKHRRHRQRHRH